MVVVDLSVIEIGAFLVVYSFVQGIGYAVANHWYEAHGKNGIKKLNEKIDELKNIISKN